MRSFSIASLMLAATAASPQSMQLPTDVDLKSAYCLRVKQNQAGYINGIANNEPRDSPAFEMVQKMARDHAADVNRLQSYLVPRITSLDPTGLIAATNRADADFKENVASGEACTPKCRQYTTPVLDSGKWSACFEGCAAEYPAHVRVNGCKVVNWLPF
jgi:hypothetical protein